MTGAHDDLDHLAAADPATPAQQLADIAARRPDLHRIILVNPRAYPELRQWIGQVSAQAPHPPYAASAAPGTAPFAPYTPPVRPRRKGLGWLIGGCGCLLIVVVIGIVVAVGLRTASFDGGDGGGAAPAASPAPSVEDQLGRLEGEIAEYRSLAAKLKGNPVGPLVTSPHWFERFQTRAEARPLNTFQVKGLLDEIGSHKEKLQQRFAEAQARRENASGSIAEGLVDSAGDGFIDIRWDADTACSTAEKEGHTTAGCTSSDPVAVHILPQDKQLGGDEGTRLTVLHELAHLYQYADLDSTPVDEKSEAMKLKDRGLFRGSGEVMSDCYALTYLDAHSLTVDGATFGYGYVCDESERQAIREWAASVNAPMPG
ncbi:hypothetical protein Q9R19_05280 [Microbacterium sp. ARD32]|uniref:variant leucine-rich repeat-containing protein n=1 Tax=Microbacterium sp. ARD32 TaxID=2962577 RepID=UPI002881ECB6|nr:hypothetical protein [Microbacterium sp. ARD32]MDT0157035.1 hypothetical protein [Microbacterium sp. ARD32]